MEWPEVGNRARRQLVNGGPYRAVMMRFHELIPANAFAPIITRQGGEGKLTVCASWRIG
jgi:hypothetical protein